MAINGIQRTGISCEVNNAYHAPAAIHVSLHYSEVVINRRFSISGY